MNIKEQIEQIKMKYDSVSTNWDKLTIDQILKIDEFLNGIIEEKTEVNRTKNKPFMTDDIFDEITELKFRRGMSWRDIAQKFGYLDYHTASTSYNQYKVRRALKMSQQQTNVSVPPADGAPIV